jgi:hypothetical protein
MVQEIGTLSTIDNLNLLQDKIDFLAQNSFTDQFDLTYKSLLKNLPNAFCNLKNVALSMAKNGTCPKGLALTKIHWNY